MPCTSNHATLESEPQRFEAEATAARHVPQLLQLAPSRTRRQRLAALGISAGAQAAVLVLLMLIPSSRHAIERAVAPEQHVLLYMPPPAVHHNPPAPVVKVPPLPKTAPKPKPLPVMKHLITVQPRPVPRIHLLKNKPIVAPKPIPVAPASAPIELNLPKIAVKAPPRPVKLNSFGAPAAVATLRRPPAHVQTGGFGSPNGVPGRAHSKTTNVAHLGVFGGPQGPGRGNGAGGAHGARGVVASGFGAAEATAVRGSGGSGHGVQLGGFGAAAAPAAEARPMPVAVHSTPVEILYKPDPVYTPEARAAHIQGEVLLRVVFEADGHLSIQGMLRSLGHGLDQQAARVAREIRFKPATRNGSPVNTVAVLHVTFQLAD